MAAAAKVHQNFPRVCFWFRDDGYSLLLIFFAVITFQIMLRYHFFGITSEWGLSTFFTVMSERVGWLCNTWTLFFALWPFIIRCVFHFLILFPSSSSYLQWPRLSWTIFFFYIIAHGINRYYTDRTENVEKVEPRTADPLVRWWVQWRHLIANMRRLIYTGLCILSGTSTYISNCVHKHV